jgi:hypothetical protein
MNRVRLNRTVGPCWGLVQMAGLEEHEAATEGWIYQNCKDFGAGGVLAQKANRTK